MMVPGDSRCYEILKADRPAITVLRILIPQRCCVRAHAYTKFQSHTNQITILPSSSSKLLTTLTALSDAADLRTRYTHSTHIHAGTLSSTFTLLLPHQALFHGEPVRMRPGGRIILAAADRIRAEWKHVPRGGPSRRMTSRSVPSTTPGNSGRFNNHRSDSSNSSNDKNDPSSLRRLPQPGDNPLDECKMLIAHYQRCCDRKLKQKRNWILTESVRVQEEYRYQRPSTSTAQNKDKVT